MIEGHIQWSPGVTLEEVEKQVIIVAYRHFRKNKSITAASLGIAIRTLDAKLEKYVKDSKTQIEKDVEMNNDREEFLKAQRGLPSKWRPKVTTPFKDRLKSSSQRTTAGANPGIPMESTPRPAPEPEVSMRIKEEVQNMSLAANARGRPKRDG